ncbi:hypothetical protein U6B65_01275 [Oscillospiraceae bacterium MB08-C2-2]|nr:hypothetical protein U6B65_01275 [Oscillospiraceae bacterium MB08-C2-2]
MKIGVALSGCDIGGVAAYSALQEIENQGFEIEMVSSSGVASMSGAMFALGCEEEIYRQAMDSFMADIRTDGMDTAIYNLSQRIQNSPQTRKIPLAINSVNMADQKTVTFTNDFVLSSQTVMTYPLQELYDAFSASISQVEGLGYYRFIGYRLCDYSILHGCPLYPLRMQGIKHVVSISFMPERLSTPYEAMAKKIVDQSALGADWHLTLRMPANKSPAEYMEWVSLQVNAFALGIKATL